MLNTVFSNHYFKHPSSHLIPLKKYSPLDKKRGYHHLSQLLNREITEDEYQYFQNLFETNGTPDIAIYSKNWNRIVNKYYQKNQMDSYFFYLRNRTIHAAYSLIYHGDITAVDRKNSFSHYALHLKFPHPHKQVLAYPNHPEFHTLMSNDISGLVYAKIHPIQHSNIHPFKIHKQSKYVYFKTEEPFLAILSKEEYKLYQHYMVIDPIWVLSAHEYVQHPAHKDIEYWINRKENSSGDEKAIIKHILVYLYSLGGKIQYKNLDIHTQKDIVDIKNAMGTDVWPYYNKHFKLEYNTLKFVDIDHPHVMYMWSALIQAASTTDILKHVWNIEKRGGIIHYCNVDALHYSLEVPYLWDSSWKLEHSAQEGIWLCPGVWRLKADNSWIEKEFSWTEHQTDCFTIEQKYPLNINGKNIFRDFYSKNDDFDVIQKSNEALLLHYFQTK